MKTISSITTRRLLIVLGAAALASCDGPVTGIPDLDQPTQPGSRSATVTFDSAFSGGLEALARQVEALRALANTRAGEDYFVATSWKPTATVGEVLAHLEALANRRLRSVGDVKLAYPTSVGGASWVYSNGTPPSTRQVTYWAYTTCDGCNSAEFPEGDMTMQQWAGSVQMFYGTYHFMGMNNGLGSGEYYTTVNGDAQQAYLSTHHYVDQNPGYWRHSYYSSSSGSV